MRAPVLALGLLLGCSGGDLTLPGSPQPVTLRIVDGDEQRALAGTRLEQPLVVQVQDAAGRPVAGAPVEFGFVDDLPDAQLDPSVVTTGADGRAAAAARLGSVSGEQVIVARVTGTASADLSATFTAFAFGGRGPGRNGGDDEDDEDHD